jgi:hypothetical protein
LVAVSKQILKNGVEYQGSAIDYLDAVDSSMYKSFMKIGEEMHKNGYRGAVGIDYIVTTENKILPCECNARVNASFYPYELRQRLFENGIDFPIVYSLKTPIKNCDSFSAFSKEPGISNMLYKGDTQSGILPYNVSTIPFGEVSFIALAKSHDEAKILSRKFKNMINALNEKTKSA